MVMLMQEDISTSFLTKKLTKNGIFNNSKDPNFDFILNGYKK